jgi:hypothetical protein
MTFKVYEHKLRAFTPQPSVNVPHLSIDYRPALKTKKALCATKTILTDAGHVALA